MADAPPPRPPLPRGARVNAKGETIVSIPGPCAVDRGTDHCDPVGPAQRLLDANRLTGEARRHKEEAAARLEEYRAASAANSPTKTKSFTDERTEWDQRLAKLGY